MNNKFRRGKVIEDIQDLVKRLQRKEWVYYRDKPKHPSFIIQMPLVVILDSLKRGAFGEAIKNEQT